MRGSAYTAHAGSELGWRVGVKKTRVRARARTRTRARVRARIRG